MKIKEMKKENKELQAKLYIQYGAVFDNICEYLNLDDKINGHNTVIRNDLLTMLYEGQQRGDEPENIIGEDYRAFADEIYKESKKISKKLLTLNISYTTLFFSSVMLILNLVMPDENLIGNFKNGVYIDQSNITFTIIYSIMISVMTIMDNKRMENRKLKGIITSILFFMIIVVDDFSIIGIGKEISVSIIPYLIVLFLMVIVGLFSFIEYKKEYKKYIKS